jgi:UPF0755 protein
MFKIQLQKKYVLLIIGIAVVLLFPLLIYAGFLSAPKNFPPGSTVSVDSGSGLLELSNKLEDEGVIRSSFWFRIAAIIFKGERGLQAGEYALEGKEGVFDLARRIVQGDYRIKRIKLTIPEGFTVKKISALFDTNEFQNFDRNIFEKNAQEGYLFPDTYFVHVNATATSTIRMLRDNFIRKIFYLMPEIEESGHSLDEIIIMASILESEANTKEDREIVSGILWKRLEKGMPLQVDSSFIYVNGKTTKDLTLEDLKIKSPYNTYLYKGLPPTPISNPGIESIQAAIHPKETSYLFFLTGTDGKMYYAKTFEEHVRNKQKFLKN